MKYIKSYQIFESIIYDLDKFKIENDKRQIIEDLCLFLTDRGFILLFDDGISNIDFLIDIYGKDDKLYFALLDDDELTDDDITNYQFYNCTGYQFDIIRDDVDFFIKQINKQLGYFVRGILIYGNDLEGGYKFDDYNEYSSVDDIPENMEVDYIQLEVIGRIPSGQERL